MYLVDQYTVSLLHFEDGLKDECGNIWTAKGSVNEDTTNKISGNSSLYIPANTYLTSINDNYAFRSGDFTIDFWVYSASPNSCYFTSSSVIGATLGIAVCGDASWVGNNSVLEGRLPLPTIPANTWTHISVVRYQGEFILFIQGKLISKAKMSGAISSKQFAIGARYNDGQYPNTQPMFIDEFRISNVARWTTDFTPPNTTTETIDAPTNLTASAGDSQVSLSWNAVEGAASYNVKRSTTAGGPYTTIATNVPSTSYLDATVTNGTMYYYVVTAVDSSGNESANSNEASATPNKSTPVPTGQELLRITMSDSSEREYKVSKVVVEDFIKWFNRNNITIGNTSYMFNKAIDGGKEYLSCSKIISFETISTKEQIFLRITMSDSSEREYKVSVAELDNFIKLFKYTTEAAANFYVFDKDIDSSKEYLFFEKIISFEVMELTK